MSDTKSKWPRIKRQWGSRAHTPAVALRFSHPFSRALKRFSEAETNKEGRQISQANILATSALRDNAELRRIYKEELTKEAGDASNNES